MAPKCWDVDVYNISTDGVLKQKFNKRVQLKIDYDPQGLSLKIVSGKFNINVFFTNVIVWLDSKIRHAFFYFFVPLLLPDFYNANT